MAIQKKSLKSKAPVAKTQVAEKKINSGVPRPSQTVNLRRK